MTTLRALTTSIRLALAASGLGAVASRAEVPTIGLPVTRTYSIEDIGVTRGPQLDFDRYGRLAVIGGGSYIVLNDGAWIHLQDSIPGEPIFLDVTNAPNGTAYFGALATWGVAEYTEHGVIEARELRPETYPEWVNVTSFTKIVTLDDRVIFSGDEGIVLLHPATGELKFFGISRIATTFTHAGEVYVSNNRGTSRLNLDTGELTPIAAGLTVHQVVHLADGRTVAASTGGSLFYFDGQDFNPVGDRRPNAQPGGISHLEALPDGGFAAAIDGAGLFIFDADGAYRLALTTSIYRRVYDLAAREPGVLWIANESSLQKLLYNDPVSVIDQRSDVVIGWPQVFQSGDHTVIASNGRLYDMELAPDGLHYEFRAVERPPTTGAWAVGTNQHHFLVGNGEGVFARHGDNFVQIPGMPPAARLFLPEDDLCIVIGIDQIAAMRFADGAWRECAPRLPGIGFPSIAHPGEKSIWIELGLNRAARVWFEDGELHTQLFLDFPWDTPVWINIGLMNELVVLSGPNNQRVYLDRLTAEPVPAPPYEQVLDDAGVSILRLNADANGVIWATHSNGVITLHPENGGYRIDTETLSAIRDLYPVITLLNQDRAWISTESALYHVSQHFNTHVQPVPQPFLVSITDGKTGREIFSADGSLDALAPLPWEQNHLVFRYFSGGYTTIHDPVYEFTMEYGANSWSVESADSLLTLPQLEEGNYRLTVQLHDGADPIGSPIVTAFTIRPPWYRSPLAYFAYWSSALLVCLGAVAWGVGRAKRKHDYLEQLVRERTDELRATMAKLTDEARTSATLAERNRLAGEIHDSLQQGLSGLALHLETTLKNDGLDPDIRSRLGLARRMVSYTRQEVQQAVWDLESPLLQNDSLSHALSKLADLIGNETNVVEVSAVGTEAAVSSTTKHHLLRIAQEAITNAVRHSGAHHVRVELKFSADTAFLAVRDDGKGFAIDEVLVGGLGHFGLRGLRSRAQKIQGDLQIESTPGQGTCVCITVPLASSPVPRSRHDEQPED